METDDKKGERNEEPLGFVLGAAARKLAKFYVQALAGQSLTPAQLFLLRQLWLEDGLPLRDLGIRAQLDATSTTWLVDQLEQIGLVQRKRNDTDRRIVRAWLTAAGRQAEATFAPEMAAWEHALAERLLRYHMPDEIAAFRDVLVTLIKTLPEGDDLWKHLSVSWETRLDRLRS